MKRKTELISDSPTPQSRFVAFGLCLADPVALQVISGITARTNSHAISPFPPTPSGRLPAAFTPLFLRNLAVSWPSPRQFSPYCMNTSPSPSRPRHLQRSTATLVPLSITNIKDVTVRPAARALTSSNVSLQPRHGRPVEVHRLLEIMQDLW